MAKKGSGRNHKQRRRYKERAFHATKRNNDLRRDMEYKTINLLCKEADVISIPTFDVNSMAQKRPGGKLSKCERIRLRCWGHGLFKLRLINKAHELGKKVLVVSEHYTSKTCGGCGQMDPHLGSSKTFACQQCASVMDRDLNGARNILLRAMRSS